MRYSNFCYKSIQNNCFSFFLFLFLHIHTHSHWNATESQMRLQFYYAIPSVFTRQSLNTVSNTKNVFSLLSYAQSLSKDLQPFCFFTLQFSFRIFFLISASLKFLNSVWHKVLRETDSFFFLLYPLAAAAAISRSKFNFNTWMRGEYVEYAKLGSTSTHQHSFVWTLSFVLFCSSHSAAAIPSYKLLLGCNLIIQCRNLVFIVPF